MAFHEKRLSLAKDFLERSLNQRESRVVRKKLVRIRSQLTQMNHKGKTDRDKTGRDKTGRDKTDNWKIDRRKTAPLSSRVDAVSVMTEGEKKLFYKMKKSLKLGNFARVRQSGCGLD